jgi:hypothetical protein
MEIQSSSGHGIGWMASGAAGNGTGACITVFYRSFFFGRGPTAQVFTIGASVPALI